MDRRRLALGAAPAAVVLAYLAASFLACGHVPPGIAKDAAAEAIRGIRLVTLRRFEILTFSVGPSAETLWLYIIGASVQALGPIRLALVLPNSLAAAAVVWMTAACVRRQAPGIPRVIPALVAASSLWLFHYGQAGLRAITAPLFLLAAAWLVDRAEAGTSDERHIGAGAVMGLSLYAYSSCRVFPIAYALHKLVQLRTRRHEWRAVLKETRLTFVGGLGASIPNVLLAIRLPDEFWGRGYYVFRGGVSERLANLAATILLPFGYPEAYRTSFGPGHAFDAIGVGLTQAGLNPIDLLTAALAAAGLVLALRRPIRPVLSFLLATLAAGDLLLGFTGPSLTRLLVLLPVYLVLASLGAGALAARLRGGTVLVSALLVVWAALQARRYVAGFEGSQKARACFAPSVNAAGERARDLLDEGKRVVVVTRGDGHIVRFYAHRHIDRLWYRELFGRPFDPASVPLARFCPDAVLIERVPELADWAASFQAPSRSTVPDAYLEIWPRAGCEASPPIRGNVLRLWSDISR